MLALAGALAVCYLLGLDTLSVGSNRLLRLIPLGIVSLLCFGFLVYLARRPPSSGRPLSLTPRAGVVAWCLLAIIAFALTSFIATEVLQSFPLSGDEVAYLDQATLLLHGKLWGSIAPIEQYVGSHYMFPAGDKLISQYPPGWPAIIAGAERVGIPAVLVNPILGAITIGVLYRFSALRSGREVAVATVAILAASPFFLFNSADFLNGCLVALLGILFVMATAAFREQPRIWNALGAGAWFSALAVTRHLDAILFAIPAAVAVLRSADRRHWAMLPVVVLGAIPLLALLLLYYQQVTGDSFRLPQTLRDAGDTLLGSKWRALRSTEILFGRGVELAEWVSPPFVVAFAWAFVSKLRGRRLRFYDLYGPAFLVGYWLYWGDGGLRWGPRYIYPALPFMALLVADAAWRALRAEHRAILAHLVVVSTIASLLQVPVVALRAHEVVAQTRDIFLEIQEAGLRHAVVVAASGTGEIWRLDPGDLARNGPFLDGDIIYAHGPHWLDPQVTATDLEETVHALRTYFPDRPIWIYRREPGNPRGELTSAG